jgi:hypothetical protein
MAKIENMEKILLIVAIVVLVVGVYVTLYASTPVFEVEKTVSFQGAVPTSSMQGLVTVNVIPAEVSENG